MLRMRGFWEIGRGKGKEVVGGTRGEGGEGGEDDICRYLRFSLWCSR